MDLLYFESKDLSLNPNYSKCMEVLDDIETNSAVCDSDSDSVHSLESELNSISKNDETLILLQASGKQAKQTQLDLKD